MASEGANAVARFTFDLDAGPLANGAKDGARALEELRAKLEADTQALRGMQLALGRMKGNSTIAKESLDKLRDRIAAQKATIAQAQANYLKLGGGFAQLKPKANGGADAIAHVKGALAAAGGPLHGFSSRIAAIRPLLASWVGVSVAVAAALTAIAAAATAGVIALAKYGIAVADARRSELLRLEGLGKMRNYWLEMLGYQRKAESGEFLQGMLDRMSAKLPLARAQIADLQSELYRAGLRGGNLEAAVEGAGIALATQGEAGKEQFKALALNAQLWGGSIKKVADDYKARLGPTAAKLMLSLDVQALKFREHLKGLFKDLKIEPLLNALKTIVDMFSQASVEGRALKVLIEGLLQPLINAAGSSVVKRFFQGIILGALEVGLFLLDIRDVFRRVFGRDALSSIDLASAAVDVARVAVWGLAIAFTALAGAVLLASIPLLIIGGVIYGAITLIRKAYNGVQEMGWSGLGLAIVQGIANGISNGVGWVLDAISNLAKRLITKFKQELRIFSPSRLFFKAGLEIPHGTELAIRTGTPKVEAAVSDMVEAPASIEGPAAGVAPVRAPAAAPVINIGENAIVIQLPSTNSTPADMMAALRVGMTELLRGAAAQMAVPNP